MDSAKQKDGGNAIAAEKAKPREAVSLKLQEAKGAVSANRALSGVEETDVVPETLGVNTYTVTV